MSKKVPQQLHAVPSQIEIVRQFESFRVICGLCKPAKAKPILWHPDKSPSHERCAAHIEHHLRQAHNIKVGRETIQRFVDSIKPSTRKTDSQDEQEPPARNTSYATLTS
jgi:hypothetical protein